MFTEGAELALIGRWVLVRILIAGLTGGFLALFGVSEERISEMVKKHCQHDRRDYG